MRRRPPITSWNVSPNCATLTDTRTGAVFHAGAQSRQGHGLAGAAATPTSTGGMPASRRGSCPPDWGYSSGRRGSWWVPVRCRTRRPGAWAPTPVRRPCPARRTRRTGSTTGWPMGVCVPCWYPCHTAMRHHPAPHTNKTMPTKKHRDGGKITGCSDHWHGGVLHRPQGTLHRRGDVGEDSSTLLPIGVGGPESHVSSPTQRVYKGTPTIGSPIQRP